MRYQANHNLRQQRLFKYFVEESLGNIFSCSDKNITRSLGYRDAGYKSNTRLRADIKALVTSGRIETKTELHSYYDKDNVERIRSTRHVFVTSDLSTDKGALLLASYVLTLNSRVTVHDYTVCSALQCNTKQLIAWRKQAVAEGLISIFYAGSSGKAYRYQVVGDFVPVNLPGRVQINESEQSPLTRKQTWKSQASGFGYSPEDLILVSLQKRDGVAVTNQRDFAKHAGVSLPTLNKWLKVLEKEGKISVTLLPKRKREYRLLVEYNKPWPTQDEYAQSKGFEDAAAMTKYEVDKEIAKMREEDEKARFSERAYKHLEAVRAAAISRPKEEMLEAAKNKYYSLPENKYKPSTVFWQLFAWDDRFKFAEEYLNSFKDED